MGLGCLIGVRPRKSSRDAHTVNPATKAAQPNGQSVEALLQQSPLYTWVSREFALAGLGWAVALAIAIAAIALYRASSLQAVLFVLLVVFAAVVLFGTFASVVNQAKFESALERETLLTMDEKRRLKGDILFLPFARARLVRRLRNAAEQQVRQGSGSGGVA